MKDEGLELEVGKLDAKVESCPSKIEFPDVVASLSPGPSSECHVLLDTTFLVPAGNDYVDLLTKSTTGSA